MSVCRVKQSGIKTFTATIEVPVGKRRRWLGGFLLSFTDKDHYTVALIDWAGFLRIHTLIGKRWQPLEQGQGPAPDKDGNYRFQAYRRGDKVTLMIGNSGYGPWELPDDGFGLAVDKSGCSFRDVSWK